MKNSLFLLSVLTLLVSITASAKIALAANQLPERLFAGQDVAEVTQQTSRLALVIGNARYPHQPLRNPLNDARAVSSLLTGIGFEVITLENASRREVERSLAELNARAGDSGISLVYFAGHAITLEGSVTLLPIDTKTGSTEALRRSGIDLDGLIRKMAAQQPDRAKLFVIDACLDNPLRLGGAAAHPHTAMTSPLALPRQTLLALATSSEAVAFDGESGLGLYTDSLVRELSLPGRDVEQILERVRKAVSWKTRSRQIPRTLSTLDSPLQLGPATLAREESPRPADLSRIPERKLVSMLTRGILPKDGEAQYELEFWQSIKDSKDAADYEAYLEAYPNGRFAPLARSRAKRYKKTTAQEKPAKVKEPAYKITEMDDNYRVLRTANIREKPSSSSKRLGELRKGSTVRVTGRTSSNWYRIRTTTGVSGFVFGELLGKPAPKISQPKRQPAPPSPVAAPSVKPKEIPKPPPPATKVKTETFRDCPSCPEMVGLPAASFVMGDNSGDRSERPAHRVTIKSPFAIGKYEVTTKEWNDCVRAGACSYRPDNAGPSESSPIRDISWSDAQEYVRWLSKITGQEYRLPTEAEWEYAARAGTQTRFWWGDRVGVGNADCKDCGGKWNRAAPADVDSYSANAFGLHSTSGGVWEWVADCWHKSYKGAPNDGRSWNEVDCRENVIRGGAWRNDASYVHSASRFKYDASVRYLLNGFRVAKTLK